MANPQSFSTIPEVLDRAPDHDTDVYAGNFIDGLVAIVDVTLERHAELVQEYGIEVTR